MSRPKSYRSETYVKIIDLIFITLEKDKIVRGFLRKYKDVFDIDPLMVEKDINYKIKALFKVTPVVKILKHDLSKIANKTKFLSRIGLCSVNKIYSLRTNNNNKDKKDTTFHLNREVKTYGTQANKSRQSRTRTDYSRLEDQLIVDWILKHQKAELVKGNSIWREIEPYHLIITGIKRSWQSLRNRYIRSILPFLHNYSVTAQQASELRAGAATD
ncbi:uncharacterized protein LOC126978370 isoform X2 [Leptidea sinapis]|uniref:uncharacterized protein LOC126978370 isoform X2 n=1 Tax=Leptidea sinapis TaxID=189913 RepID=UPI0021C3AE55|nr:uncharacterized protein LOC126978370 isoform X2 [Leptidea sinapis]